MHVGGGLKSALKEKGAVFWEMTAGVKYFLPPLITFQLSDFQPLRLSNFQTSLHRRLQPLNVPCYRELISRRRFRLPPQFRPKPMVAI